MEINQRFFIENNTGYSECPLDFFAHGNLKGSKFSLKQKTDNLPAIRVFPEHRDKTSHLTPDYDWVGGDLQILRIKWVVVIGKEKSRIRRLKAFKITYHRCKTRNTISFFSYVSGMFNK
jgi:hypothetical protein